MTYPLNELNNFLNDTVEDTDDLVKDFISDENILVLKDYIVYFVDIPKENLIEVFEQLCTLIIKFQENSDSWNLDKYLLTGKHETLIEMRNEDMEISKIKTRELYKDISDEKLTELIKSKEDEIIQKYQKKIEKLKGKKPSVQIKKDIKILNDSLNKTKLVQDMIIRLYGSRHRETEEVQFLNIPKAVYKTYYANEESLLNTQKMIKDLKNEEFSIISYMKYTSLKRTKEPLKKYLKDVRAKYKLKNVSQIENEMISSFSQNRFVFDN
ncbi:hypothetical protein ALC152_01380 [Arcobacter sp. 15-2]|uniref:hypothetical protein n=1 Tax=Arcobacter sp. 15-2 TaxID=3374109 RepID=UPI00399CEBCB